MGEIREVTHQGDGGTAHLQGANLKLQNTKIVSGTHGENHFMVASKSVLKRRRGVTGQKWIEDQPNPKEKNPRSNKKPKGGPQQERQGGSRR